MGDMMPKRIYAGWLVVGMAAVISGVLVGTTFASFGVFVLPVSEELQLSRAEMHTGMALMTFGNAAVAPVLGRLLDRKRANFIMAVGAVIYALSLATLALSPWLWLSALVLSFSLPAGYLAAGTLTANVLVARWFSARRGRAMLLAGLGMSFGVMLGPLGVGELVEAHGWRNALLILGAVEGLLLLAFALGIKDRPGRDDADVADTAVASPSATSDAATSSPLTTRDLLRRPIFWMMVLSAGVVLAGNTTFMTSLVPMAREMGLPMLQATSLMTLVGVSGIAGGLFCSTFADKIDRVGLVTSLFLLDAAIYAMLLAFGTTYPVMVAAAICLGISTGTLSHTFYALLADTFGTESYGMIRGTSLLIFSVIAMGVIRLGGELIDYAGGYGTMLATFLVAYVVAAITLHATRWLRSPVRAGLGARA